MMMWVNRVGIAALAGICALGLSNASRGQDKVTPGADWPMIGGTAGNTHYSPLKQINRSNVAKVQVAWKFDTGQPR